jgi:Ca2+/H+ antiporter
MLYQLFHLIAREETISSYKLSQHMAQTAEFSYRDAASMKTLAVVTMFFLPGSFVSALFSTQLFAWDDIDQLSNSIGVPTTPQLTLYWAVTIPLTLVTFVLYFLWLWYQKNERKRNFKTDEQMDEAAAARGEGLSNVNRMQTFISEVKGLSHKV